MSRSTRGRAPGLRMLATAAATAAGVAGGALLFQGIESLFGRGASAGMLGGQGVTPGLGETVVNNYYDDKSDRGSDANFQQFDPGAPGVQDANFDNLDDSTFDNSDGSSFGDGGGYDDV